MTVADFGKGKVIYVGAILEKRFYVDLAQRVSQLGKISFGPKLPAAVDFALRSKGERKFRFFLNFSDRPQMIALPGKHRDLMSTKSFLDRYTLPPLGVAVISHD